MESIEVSALANGQVYDDASLPYVGRWSRLISTTNWEKGQIIHDWRQAMIASNAPAGEYSDDAWSRRVGGVSGQHVGRLRRVSDRFGDVRHQFNGLYWSHFQAALDWDDAEMWLEGAVQNDWSVSQMRLQRWQTLGGIPDLRPRDEDIVPVELDEDSPEPGPETANRSAATYSGHAEPLSPAGPDFGDEGDTVPLPSPTAVDAVVIEPEPIRPFDSLPELPDDLTDALDTFKLAILRHKSSGWESVSADAVVQVLEGLKQLVWAPA